MSALGGKAEQSTGDNVLVPSTGGMGLGLRVQSSSFTSSAIGNISFVER
ncbi:MAG TPA: hypothetical protein VEK55_02905 [Xanthobacteraceae bacterium]|nr:hypothetical protein [Xanthobacteraceae bacterium]